MLDGHPCGTDTPVRLRRQIASAGNNLSKIKSDGQECPSPPSPLPHLRYTSTNVTRICLPLVILLSAASLASAQQNSFRVHMSDVQGKQSKATLLFDDQGKAVEVRPHKLPTLTIPYAHIEKCSYEYTTERTIALTDAKTHWLECAYHERDAAKALLLRMEEHDAVHILEALKSHTGIDAEVLGNADKRHEPVWRKR